MNVDIVLRTSTTEYDAGEKVFSVSYPSLLMNASITTSSHLYHMISHNLPTSVCVAVLGEGPLVGRVLGKDKGEAKEAGFTNYVE